MTLTIFNNLKELRKKKNNTQENLAEFLNVSINAVSKWERGECYPDIELLPKIAAYYDVSVDDLLGVGEMRKRERIQEYLNQSEYLWNRDDGGESYLALWREAQKEFPNDWDVLVHLMRALYSNDSRKNAPQFIEIAEKILAECTNDNKRHDAMQILCLYYRYYSDPKDLEIARKYAEMLPNLDITSDDLLAHVLTGDDLIKHRQATLRRLTDMLANEIYYSAGWLGKESYHRAVKLYEFIYENSDFGYAVFQMKDCYYALAWESAKEQNNSETIGYLKSAIKYAVIYDTQEDFNHTSPLLNRIRYERKGGAGNLRSYLLKQMTENKDYDFCRNDEAYIKLLEDLKQDS